ncbi:CMRF35-like molecule 7 isoform X3 [Megalobrama amblycephala]|uniref:CMRF35-like molecule 7 isoform X3 n=1 Tax=Megalobrama amblycephala TaxID=75352 RepID=UPI0020143350|nr:CMRF35-like molecule 7 isoform X3 [Megalobrama amblycephala]
MRNLQNKDTGSYWCAVEIEGVWIDKTEQLHLTVQSAPDVSVVSSSVSGHEGGNVSVQCFYSSGYQNKLKQWCRYKDQRCYTVGRTDTSQSSSVQISDNVRRRSFTVLMTGLRLSDSGWFFCSAGDQQTSVQLTVTVPDVSLEDPHVPVSVTEPKPVVTTEAFERNGRVAALSSTTPNNESTVNSEEQHNEHHGHLEVWISVVVLLLLMVAVVLSAIILRNKLGQY